MNKWIPVEKKLPSNTDFVLITVRDDSGDTPFTYVDVGWYFEAAETWCVYDGPCYDEVLAWMEFPEPYEGR